MAMNKRKTTTAVVAGVTAAALLLGGTFAWTSISQQAKNEKAGIVNVGGRLHDDFNGTNKDVYVENFTDPLDGGQPIYARVKLTEYMEVGSEAGKLNEAGTEYAENRKAVPVVAGTDINNVETWTTHVPETDCAVCGTGETCKIHEHWTWDMDGQTTFMPTFNKDKDSLEADINGTYAGTNPTDKIYYDDYVIYTTEEGGITVDMTAEFTKPEGAENATALTEAEGNVTTVTGNAVYDNDADTAPNTTEGSYLQEEETHTAKQTAESKVITMAEWSSATYNSAPGDYWVYDTDGWAYWANPIMPGEATGLLLDSINMTKNPGEKCYYAINVVGQFATVGDWEYFDGTEENGVFDGTDAAKTLLETISAKVPNVIVTNESGKTTVVQGDTVNFSASVDVGPVRPLAQGDFEWTVLNEDRQESEKSQIVENEDGTATLTVGADERSSELIIVARSTTYSGAVGYNAVAVELAIPYALLTENGTDEEGDATYTLSFVRSREELAAGDSYEGNEIKMIEELGYNGIEVPNWEGNRKITEVIFVDEFKVTSTENLFQYWIDLETIDLSKLNVSDVTNMDYMFSDCSNLKTVIGLSGWDVGKVTSMSYMFNACTKLVTIEDLSKWDVSSVENMDSMFRNCEALETIGDLSGWNVSNVTNIKSMFLNCYALETIGDLSKWNVSNVKNMSYMFSGCHALRTIGDLSDWDVSQVTNMDSMFYNCKNLTLDCSDWTVTNVTLYGDFNTVAGGDTIATIIPPTWVN